MNQVMFEQIRSRGLAHFSYLLGRNGVAAVIDPRRDCEVYVDLVQRRGYQLRYIIETHRNEDYAIGSLELARLTGAGSGTLSRNCCAATPAGGGRADV